VAATIEAPSAERRVNPWVVLVLVCMAQFMVVLDSTIVNVALPAIQRDLHFTVDSLQWVVNAYTLVLGGFLLLGGRAGDLFGRKRMFLFGVSLFTFASLMNAVGTSAGMLIVFRAMQGFGAAFISPIALSIVTTTFTEGRQRAKLDLRYVGFTIPSSFVVGYGLDVGERFRNLQGVYTYVGPEAV